MDYGHELLFGTFHAGCAATSSRRRAGGGRGPGRPRPGDVPDHPYQPGFLDTRTLLTYVVARARGFGSATTC